jgi:hypothetical protein
VHRLGWVQPGCLAEPSLCVDHCDCTAKRHGVQRGWVGCYLMVLRGWSASSAGSRVASCAKRRAWRWRTTNCTRDEEVVFGSLGWHTGVVGIGDRFAQSVSPWSSACACATVKSAANFRACEHGAKLVEQPGRDNDLEVTPGRWPARPVREPIAA